jgi:hypothetical protein
MCCTTRLPSAFPNTWISLLYASEFKTPKLAESKLISMVLLRPQITLEPCLYAVACCNCSACQVNLAATEICRLSYIIRQLDRVVLDILVLQLLSVHIRNWWQSRKEGDPWEDQGVDGWTILKWILERQDGIDRIDLAQDMDKWRALVNTVMKLRFHKMLGNPWVAAQLAASQEGLSSMSEWVSECWWVAVSCGHWYYVVINVITSRRVR